MYSPLPGSQEQWHDVAAQAKRATAWFAVWLMATAGALAGLVVLAAYNVTNDFWSFWR